MKLFTTFALPDSPKIRMLAVKDFPNVSEVTQDTILEEELSLVPRYIPSADIKSEWVEVVLPILLVRDSKTKMLRLTTSASKAVSEFKKLRSLGWVVRDSEFRKAHLKNLIIKRLPS